MLVYEEPLGFIEGKTYGPILGYTDGLVCGCHEIIKLGISDGEVMGTTLRNAGGFSGAISVLLRTDY